MSLHYISRGECISLQATKRYESGETCRVHGFSGVSLRTVEPGETLTLQLEGIFELELEKVDIGDLIYIQPSDGKLFDFEGWENVEERFLFGRALTNSDSNNKFYCRLTQDYEE